MTANNNLFVEHKINETYIYGILSEIFDSTNIPESLIREIETFLYQREANPIKVIYQIKCDDLILTKEVCYKIIILEKYNFIMRTIISLLSKYFISRTDFILPCYPEDFSCLPNESFKDKSLQSIEGLAKSKRFVVLSLFIQLFEDFQHRQVYCCTHANNETYMNNKYYQFLSDIED